MDFSKLIGKTIGWAGEINNTTAEDPDMNTVYLFFTDMTALCIHPPEMSVPPSFIPKAEDVIADILRQHKPSAEKIMSLDGFLNVKKMAEELRASKTATEKFRESLGEEAVPKGELQPPTVEPSVVEIPLPPSMEPAESAAEVVT